MGMTDTQGKKGKWTQIDTEIVTANLKAFVLLHLDLFFLITFLESSGWVFILSREDRRVQIGIELLWLV